MSLGLIIPFYSEFGGDEILSLSSLFKKMFLKWEKYIDSVYISDACILKQGNIAKFPKTKYIETRPANSHWGAVSSLAERVTEDNFLLLDQDMFLYDPKIVENIVEDLKEYDFVSILDNSGPILFEKNEDRAERSRMCPYLMAGKTALLLDQDFSPQDGFDSFGKFTKKMVDDGKKIKELPDDRFTVLMDDSNEITASSWLDGNKYNWSKQPQPSRGYYHIRNASMGERLIHNFREDKDKYYKEMIQIPRSEALRILAWWDAIGCGRREIIEIVKTLGVSVEEWDKYINYYFKLYQWIGDHE